MQIGVPDKVTTLGLRDMHDMKQTGCRCYCTFDLNLPGNQELRTARLTSISLYWGNKYSLLKIRQS
jgi:hypothetical protein